MCLCAACVGVYVVYMSVCMCMYACACLCAHVWVHVYLCACLCVRVSCVRVCCVDICMGTLSLLVCMGVFQYLSPYNSQSSSFRVYGCALWDYGLARAIQIGNRRPRFVFIMDPICW